MVDGRGYSRLPPESLAGGGIRAGLSNHLDRDRPIQPIIVCGIHDTHATFPELPSDTVPSNPIRDRCRHDVLLEAAGFVRSGRAREANAARRLRSRSYHNKVCRRSLDPVKLASGPDAVVVMQGTAASDTPGEELMNRNFSLRSG